MRAIRPAPFELPQGGNAARVGGDAARCSFSSFLFISCWMPDMLHVSWNDKLRLVLLPVDVSTNPLSQGLDKIKMAWYVYQAKDFWKTKTKVCCTFLELRVDRELLRVLTEKKSSWLFTSIEFPLSNQNLHRHKSNTHYDYLSYVYGIFLVFYINILVYICFDMKMNSLPLSSNWVLSCFFQISPAFLAFSLRSWIPSNPWEPRSNENSLT